MASVNLPCERTLASANWASLISSPGRPWLPWLVVVAVAYSIVCHAMRYRRLRCLHKKFPYGPAGKPGKKPYSAMTDEDAYEILLSLSTWECPTVHELGLEFALLRTYGIPSISRLLVQTRQLSASENVARRYADTAALLSEIYGNPPSAPRSAEALARLNYLHGVYIKAGRISNDDMLYVLSLFMNQPPEHIDRLDWRPVSELERCAYGVFHKSMGDAMGIDFGCLPSAPEAGSGPGGWMDGLHFYAELDSWCKAYEEREMAPHPDNYATAVHTRDLLMGVNPSFLRGSVARMATAAMDDRFRDAIAFERPPAVYLALFDAVFALKRLVCRHLLPPRLVPYRLHGRSVQDGDVGADGRRNFSRWSTHPVYVRPTVWNRWGPGAWAGWLIGVPLPGDEGMVPEGYLLKDVGPDHFRGKGWGDVADNFEKLRVSRIGGCPFA